MTKLSVAAYLPNGVNLYNGEWHTDKRNTELNSDYHNSYPQVITKGCHYILIALNELN